MHITLDSFVNRQTFHQRPHHHNHRHCHCHCHRSLVISPPVDRTNHPYLHSPSDSILQSIIITAKKAIAHLNIHTQAIRSSSNLVNDVNFTHVNNKHTGRKIRSNIKYREIDRKIHTRAQIHTLDKFYYAVNQMCRGR